MANEEPRYATGDDYKGVHLGREFSLENVAAEFKGLTYTALSPEQRRQVDNTFIQATIVKTDGSAKSLEAVYQVFERLNSGGTQLTPMKFESPCIRDHLWTS
jgi:hypothetical protein